MVTAAVPKLLTNFEVLKKYILPKTLSLLRGSLSSFYEVVVVHYSEFPHLKLTEIPSDFLVVPKPTNY